MVSYGIGGLVVAHVGRRLLFGRSPRQCAMFLELAGILPLKIVKAWSTDTGPNVI
jgi:hypothetical protein